MIYGFAVSSVQGSLSLWVVFVGLRQKRIYIYIICMLWVPGFRCWTFFFLTVATPWGSCVHDMHMFCCEESRAFHSPAPNSGGIKILSFCHLPNLMNHALIQ